MMELFEKYKDSNHVTEAVLVGRNLFNRNPADKDVFSAYFDLLCSLAENLPLLSERKNFSGQAGVALAFFSENANLDENTVNDISTYEQRLNTIRRTIEAVEQEQAAQRMDQITAHNNECIKKIYHLKDSLSSAASQEEFEGILSELGVVDRNINKDVLTDEQATHYDSLTKACTATISEKMREFEQKSNVDYNKQAANAYAKAFRQFQENESKYKNQTQLFALVSETMFAFDASRLFNETLIYYNHVYSYIFSKLDDDGKLALTRFSIECERKLRR